MITKDQARHAVEQRLGDMCRVPGDRFVIVDDLTLERGFGWVFFYDSERYQKTGNIADAIAGNGPVIVNKSTGDIEFSSPSRSVQKTITDYEGRL